MQRSLFKRFACLMACGCLGAFGIDPVQAKETKTIRGFADFNASFSDARRADSQFGLGQYDTYITGKLNNEVSYLSEVVFEFADSDFVLDVERLWVRYNFDDALSFSIGKFHSPLGYWNRTYHHGSLLHTSVDRPLFLRFEDEGGILPIHTTGILLSGREISSARLYYDLMIGNGLGSTPTEDNDDRKSVNFYVHSKVIEDVDFGFSVYVDQVSKGSTVFSHTDAEGELVPLAEEIDQVILDGSVGVDRDNIEFLSEFTWVRNEGNTSDVVAWTKGFYAIGGYEIEGFEPFFKIDYLKVKNDDPLFTPTETTGLSFGLKYDISYLANLKIQYTNLDVEDNEDENLLSTQFAIGF